MNLVAVIEIVIISIYFILPLYPSGWITQRRLRVEVRELRADPHRRHDPAGLRSGGTLSAKKWFTGPKHTIDQAVIDAFED